MGIMTALAYLLKWRYQKSEAGFSKQVTPTKSVYIIESRSLLSGKGCYPVLLGSQVCLCVSHDLSNSQVSTESKSGPMLNATYYTGTGQVNMFSRVTELSVKNPKIFLSPKEHFNYEKGNFH